MLAKCPFEATGEKSIEELTNRLEFLAKNGPLQGNNLSKGRTSAAGEHVEIIFPASRK